MRGEVVAGQDRDAVREGVDETQAHVLGVDEEIGDVEEGSEVVLAVPVPDEMDPISNPGDLGEGPQLRLPRTGADDHAGHATHPRRRLDQQLNPVVIGEAAHVERDGARLFALSLTKPEVLPCRGGGGPRRGMAGPSVLDRVEVAPGDLDRIKEVIEARERELSSGEEE